MNFQQLRIIRETVRRNFNLTEVANALYTSQSGVSKHITEGGGQRRDPRLGHQRRDDALHNRFGGRPGPVPGAGAPEKGSVSRRTNL